MSVSIEYGQLTSNTLGKGDFDSSHLRIVYSHPKTPTVNLCHQLLSIISNWLLVIRVTNYLLAFCLGSLLSYQRSGASLPPSVRGPNLRPRRHQSTGQAVLSHTHSCQIMDRSVADWTATHPTCYRLTWYMIISCLSRVCPRSYFAAW